MFSEVAEIALVAARLGQFQQLPKTRVILILNFTRPHAITYTNIYSIHLFILSHSTILYASRGLCIILKTYSLRRWRGIRARASGEAASEKLQPVKGVKLQRETSTSETRLFTNPLTASLSKKHSRAKSRQLRRLKV